MRTQDYKVQFKDKKSEKNAGEIMHMVRKNDQYSNMAWMCGLRGDRDTKSKQIEKKVASPQKGNKK